MKAPRIASIDLAYAISVCVVICFSLSAGLTSRESTLSVVSYDLISDTFAALFLFLNGITASLMMRRGISSRRKAKAYLVRKGILFVIIGMATSILWPTQILVTLGLLFLAAPMLTQLTGSILRALYVVAIPASVLLFSFGATEGAAVLGTFSTSADFISNFVDYTIVSGYFSLLPWAVFFLSGVLFGRLDFLNPKIRRSSGFYSWIAIGAGSILQIFGGALFVSKSQAKSDLVFPFFQSPEFNLISFILIATGLSIVILNLCAKWGESKLGVKPRMFLQRMGSMKHLLYINHLVYGLVFILIFGQHRVHTIGRELCLIVFFVGVSIVFTWLWKKQFTLGPVEWVLKMLSGSNEKT
jgi:uncharacterized protein